MRPITVHRAPGQLISNVDLTAPFVDLTQIADLIWRLFDVMYTVKHPPQMPAPKSAHGAKKEILSRMDDPRQ